MEGVKSVGGQVVAILGFLVEGVCWRIGSCGRLEEGGWIGRYDWCGVANVDVLSREERRELQSMCAFVGVGNDQLMPTPSMDR
jgi:hypothetical protein